MLNVPENKDIATFLWQRAQRLPYCSPNVLPLDQVRRDLAPVGKLRWHELVFFRLHGMFLQRLLQMLTVFPRMRPVSPVLGRSSAGVGRDGVTVSWTMSRSKRRYQMIRLWAQEGVSECPQCRTECQMTQQHRDREAD